MYAFLHFDPPFKRDLLSKENIILPWGALWEKTFSFKAQYFSKGKQTFFKRVVSLIVHIFSLKQNKHTGIKKQPLHLPIIRL